MSRVTVKRKIHNNNNNNNNNRTTRNKRQKPLRKSFLFNPNDPKRSFDVYIDKNPHDTIPIKYKTVDDVKETIQKLEVCIYLS
jgi:hypothetical protein